MQTPEQAFGKLMSVSDTLMWRYYALLLGYDNDKIINKVVELIKNEGLFDIVLNAIKEVDPEIKEEINNFVANPTELLDLTQIISDEIEQLSDKKLEKYFLSIIKKKFFLDGLGLIL